MIDGVSHNKTFKDRKAGEVWAKQLEVNAARGLVGMPQDVTLARAYADYLRTHPKLATATLKLNKVFWETRIRPVYATRLVSSIRTSELQNWVAHLLSAGLSTASVHRIMNLLKAVLADAVTHNRVAKNTATDVKLPKIQRVREVRMLTSEEVERVLQACDSPRLLALVRVGLGTAMRRGELMAMRWDWIDWPGEVIRIPASLEAGFTPKGRRPREIPLLPDVQQSLRTWRAHTDGKGTVFSGVNLQRWARQIRERCPGVPFRWHLLRHTAISRLAQAGVHLSTAQKIAGHASVRLTADIYTHASNDAYEQVKARLPLGIVWERGNVIDLKARRRATKR